MNERYMLSFCIPTYNNSQAAYSIVTEILKSENQSIEVVISDNSSPDNTVELLNTIKDSRLNIYSYERMAVPL